MHPVADVSPSAPLAVPAEQFWQADGVVEAEEGLKVPLGHCVQDAPAVTEYVPGRQLLQLEPPENCPGLHW